MRAIVIALVGALLIVAPGSASANESGESVVLAFTGDTVIHLPVSAAAARNGDPYDFGPMFSPVSHLLSLADLAVCHLETPLDPDGRPSGYPLFNAPTELATALAGAGYDGCSTASNHSFDRGVGGVLGTLDVLDAAGLKQAGSLRVPEGSRFALYEAGGLTIGHVSGTYWLNGLRLPSEMPWLVQLLDTREMIGAAAMAKNAGADLVVASVHCCTEYVSQPTPGQVDFARQLIGSAYVDLVVTHHSHVVGPIERVGDEFVLHGLGNFLSAQRQFPALQDGVIAMIEAVEGPGGWRFESVSAVPTLVSRYSYRIVAAEDGSPSFARTMNALESMGTRVGVYEIPGLTSEQLAMIE